MGWETLLAWVTGKVDESLRLRIEYLIAENRILRNQLNGRIRLSDKERITLAVIGKKLGKDALEQIASIVTPDTILSWHRRLVAKKFDTSDRRKSKPVGRPETDGTTTDMILRLARENSTWGYRRIVGAMKHLQVVVSHQTVKTILVENGFDPAPQRKSKTSWSDFIKSHTDCLLATDFFTTEVWTPLGLVTHFVLFFIHIQTRKVFLGGITTNPNDTWMRQVARNLTMTNDGILSKCRYLIRDRDTKFTVGFDMILASVGIEPVKLPPMSPDLNAFAERFVRSIKQECLGRMIFFGEPSLRHAINEYIEHYHHERPHQGTEIGNTILFPRPDSDPAPRDGPIICHRRLGGLLKYYQRKEAA